MRHPPSRRRWPGSAGLQARSFVGTESRLNTVFDLLRQIVFGTETDPGRAARRAAGAGGRSSTTRSRGSRPASLTVLDSRGFARPLPAVRRYRPRAARRFPRGGGELPEAGPATCGRRSRPGTAAKGELLDDVLGSRETIADSDQGRSFQAFYDFLLSQARQEELTSLLDRVHQLTEISRAPIRGCGTSTTTGWTPPSAPRPRCASSPSSSAAFSTTRCGWRTAG